MPMTTIRLGETTVARVDEQMGPGFPAHFGAPHTGWVHRQGPGYRFEFDHGEPA